MVSVYDRFLENLIHFNLIRFNMKNRIWQVSAMILIFNLNELNLNFDLFFILLRRDSGRKQMFGLSGAWFNLLHKTNCKYGLY